MRIAGLSVTRRTLPVQGLNTSYGKTRRERDYVFVRIATDEQLVGFGEASCLTEFTGETPASVTAILEEEVAEFLVGRDPFSIEFIYRELTSALPHNTTSLAAVDMALHDIMGRAVGRPAAALLGGMLRQRLDVVGAVGIQDPEVTAELAGDHVDHGHRTIKLKVGENLDRDVAAIARVREAVGPNVHIRIDANQGLRLSEALRLIEHIRPYNIQYFEQPVAQWDIAGLAELRRRGGVPIAADESNMGVRECLGLLQARAVDYLVVKLVKCGGLFPAKQILRLADMHRIPCTITSPYETSIGVAANVQLAASATRLSSAIEVLDPARIPGDVAQGLRFEAGQVMVPDRPGLGVTVDPELFG